MPTMGSAAMHARAERVREMTGSNPVAIRMNELLESRRTTLLFAHFVAAMIVFGVGVVSVAIHPEDTVHQLVARLGLVGFGWGCLALVLHLVMVRIARSRDAKLALLRSEHPSLYDTVIEARATWLK